MAQNDPKSTALVQFVKSDLESIAPYIERLLPWKGGLERFVQMTELAIRRNFDLLSCNRNSFLLSLLWCAQKNLEPGVDDGCWLIPFKQVVTPVPAYKGLIKVAVETGSVLDVQPYCIYQADVFEYTLGLNPTLTHVPAKFGSDRGALIGAYVVFTMPDGTKRFAPPMDRPSIEKIREVSPAYRGDKTGSIWVKWEEAMFLKTAIKQGFKYIPVKAALRDLIYDDNQLETGTRVDLLLRQSGVEMPELLEEPPPAQAETKGKLEPDSKPIDFSKLKNFPAFDALAGPKIQDLHPEDQTLRISHLKIFLQSLAQTRPGYKKNQVAECEALLVSGMKYFEPFIDPKKEQQPGFWGAFLAWEAKPDRPWNQEQTEPVTEPGAEAEAGFIPRFEGDFPGNPKGREQTQKEDDGPVTEGEGQGEEPFEARKNRVWGLVVQKYGKTKDMKENLGIARSADITEDNVDDIEEKVTA